MSERRPIRLLDRSTGELVNAFLIDEVSKEQVFAAHGVWQPYREKALRRLRVQKISWPEHWHWDWSQKARKLDFLAYRCIGVEHHDEMQGLMMLSTIHRQSRWRGHEGKPTIYIEYIESAPWNLAALAESPKFAGIGTRLLEAAVEFSVQEGCAGRLALHSLPQSETFYRRYMTETAVDPVSDSFLTYFEMTADQAPTIRRLADVLRLPASQLLVLSGNVSAPNEKVHKAAVQFAARIHEAEKLNPEQAKALRDFVQALMEAA